MNLPTTAWMRRVELTLPRQLVDALDAAARRHTTSRSHLIRIACRRLVGDPRDLLAGHYTGDTWDGPWWADPDVGLVDPFVYAEFLRDSGYYSDEASDEL